MFRCLFNYHVIYLILIRNVPICLNVPINLFLAIPGLEVRWEEICCYFLLYAQNELPEVKMAALKALNKSTKILSQSQRQNYYYILCSLIESDIPDSIRNEILSCFKEIAKIYKEEIITEVLSPKLSILSR